ncbi:uncharacterized protein LOC109726520 [Ananas comosus]|uniref:Uncharacterized protein LOC109726520 n=1 Tax=Ananas comosus TaxID=4615 RepID=A0A6P5GV10_ANACO|nr:uncharacterized protein LOC109726520 [Ananas comosus]
MIHRQSPQYTLLLCVVSVQITCLEFTTQLNLQQVGVSKLPRNFTACSSGNAGISTRTSMLCKPHNSHTVDTPFEIMHKTTRVAPRRRCVTERGPSKGHFSEHL